MLIYYIIMAVLATLNLIIYVTQQDRRSNTNITVLFYISFISNLGYLALATSSNVEMALLANKICYLCGCFLLPHILFAILQLCSFSIPKILRFCLYAINVVMYSFILTTGYLPIYYKNVSLGHNNGVTYLIKEYGFAHTLYYVLLFGYILIVLGFVIYLNVRQKSIPFKHMLLLSAICCSGIISFLLGKLLPDGVEVMPLLCVVFEWVFLFIRQRVNMYDIIGSISNTLNQQQTYGYVTFDLEKNYLGSNNVATEFFPELQDLKIDFPIEVQDNNALKHISEWLAEFNDNELIKTYKTDDKYYRCTLKHMYHNNTKCGFLIEIIDNTDREKYLNLINRYNAELTSSVNEKTAHIRAMQEKILFAMGNMVENRDSNTGGHIYRTSHVMKLLVDVIKEDDKIQFPDYFYSAVIKYAPLHDLGKIAIDDSILRKPGKLTDEEYDIIKTHSERGAKIVNDILGGVEDENLVTIAYNIARYHHEKWNGTGYPCHLSGEDIPFEARIMALADVYDALVSKRSYKEKMSYEQAYDIIKDSMGSHFDPKLFKYFEKCRAELEQYYDTQE